MLGRQENQPGLAELYLWSGKNKPLVDEGSFYDRFAKLRPSLLRDEDFIHWYVEGKGRPSVPPAVVAGAFLLALRDNCSDREAEQRMRYDLRWKWALDLGLDDAGCDHSSLCVFRARLLAHEEEDQLFKGLLEKAIAAGLLPKRTLQVLDSSPLLGAAAVEDTYKLLRRALHLVVKAHEKKLPKELKERLKRYRTAAKPKLDWSDPAARKVELNRLVEDAEAALAGLPEEGEWESVGRARQLLQQVARQDVEADADGGLQIRQEVAKDRVVSTVDPQMRHGRKSSAGLWNGYKKHLSEEPETELITAVAVTPANQPDGPVAIELLEQQAEAGLVPAEVVADQAYAGSELRAKALELGEGTTILTKASVLPETGYFPKSDFEIDCKQGTVRCPAGQLAYFKHQPGKRTKATFSQRVCGSCPLLSRCTPARRGRREIHIEAYEEQLHAARQRRLQPDFALLFSKRPTVERKQAHWNRKGGRKSRYIGQRKTRLQAFWSAALVNLERLMVLGTDLSPKPSSPEHPGTQVLPSTATIGINFKSLMWAATSRWRLVATHIHVPSCSPSLAVGPTATFSTAF